MGAFDAIRSLRIGLANPVHIRTWSSGEVTKAETIHYRTQKPVKDGLFCEVIFGPTRDWSCACGKYRHKRQPGFRCERCGVELAPATVRRERMGHIQLATPIVHPWYVQDRTLSLLLDLSPWELSALLAYQRYLVLQIDEERRRLLLHLAPDRHASPDWAMCQQFATLNVGDLVEVGQYHAFAQLFPETFEAKTGAEAVQQLLHTLDLDALAEQIQEEIAGGELGENEQKKAIRRLQVVTAFQTSGQHPEWMILPVIPVLPPELRPLLALDTGRIASSDVNELYARVLHRNTRITRFLEQGAPEIILNNERRMLQEACQALFDNAHAKKKTTDSRRRPLKSLTDVLQGKQ